MLVSSFEQPHHYVNVRLYVAVIEEGAGILCDEFVDERLARLDGGLRDVGHAVHRVGMDGAVKMDGVREVMGVRQGNPHPVALFDPDRRARHPRHRGHSLKMIRPFFSLDVFVGINTDKNRWEQIIFEQKSFSHIA